MAVVKKGSIYHYRFMVDGVRYQGSTKETVPAKARQFESQLMAKIKNGEQLAKKLPLLSEVSVLFLAEIKAQVAAKNLAPNTARSYNNGWNLLAATDLPKMRIDRITRGSAAGLSFPGGPWNARNAQITLGRILHWAAENDFIRSAPSIKLSKAKGRTMRILPWMAEAILKHLDRDCSDAFKIIMNCGMRVEEILRMRWEHIDWAGMNYFVPSGKTDGSRRHVPISEEMMQVLRSREHNDSEWVFPTPRITEATRDRALAMFKSGASIRAVSMSTGLSWPLAKEIRAGKFKCRPDEHRVTVAKQWEEARAAAGLDPKFVLYLGRHEFAKSYLEAHGNIYTLSKILGHASIATTMRYLNEDQGEARDVINRRNNRGLHVVVKSA